MAYLTLTVFLILLDFAKKGEKFMANMSKSEIGEMLEVVKRQVTNIDNLISLYNILGYCLRISIFRLKAARLQRKWWNLRREHTRLQFQLDLLKHRCELWKKASFWAPFSLYKFCFKDFMINIDIYTLTI